MGSSLGSLDLRGIPWLHFRARCAGFYLGLRLVCSKALGRHLEIFVSATGFLPVPESQTERSGT